MNPIVLFIAIVIGTATSGTEQALIEHCSASGGEIVQASDARVPMGPGVVKGRMVVCFSKQEEGGEGSP